MAMDQKKPFTQKGLPVLITVDVCDGSFDQDERKSRFKDLMDLLPDIRDLLGETISKRTKSKTESPVTWYVRADMQVKEITGNSMGLYQGWKDFWEGIKGTGGEIGWHPHLYKRHGTKWVPIRDPKKIRSEANKIWREISSLSGADWQPVTCRMGESVGSNELMRFLNSIGILADTSAIPGRKRDDGNRWFDWEPTPEAVYHPVLGDYRRPSKALGSGDRVAGEEPLSIIEIPYTVLGIRAPYDSKESNVKRYIDLSFDTKALKKAIGTSFVTAEYLMLVVHPMQAMGREVPDGGLVVGGLDVVRKNLGLIFDHVEKTNRTAQLKTVGEYAKLWVGDTSDISEVTSEDKAGVKRESRDSRVKGGIQRTLIEGRKAVKRPAKGGKSWKQGQGGGRGSSVPPRRGPRGR